MQQDFLRASLAKLGTPVCRVGLSATYRPGRATIHKALDEGLNYFFYFGFDNQMVRTLRETIGPRRDRYVLATGGCNWIVWHQPLRKALERRLRQMRTEYIDLFHFLGVTGRSDFTTKVREELQAVRESGLVRGVSISTHDRKFATELLRDGLLDAAMVRYNAGNRGAEVDIFPHLPDSKPVVINFTATRWRTLLRGPIGYRGEVPTAGMCYRFVLSHPSVDVCLMAPTNLRQFQENMAEIRRGPLDEGEMRFMREFGSKVGHPLVGEAPVSASNVSG